LPCWYSVRVSRKSDGQAAARVRRKPATARRDEELERLERALAEAHEYQAATSEVLSIIARSPADAQPVFEAIAQGTGRLARHLRRQGWCIGRKRVRRLMRKIGLSRLSSHPISAANGQQWCRIKT